MCKFQRQVSINFPAKFLKNQAQEAGGAAVPLLVPGSTPRGENRRSRASRAKFLPTFIIFSSSQPTIVLAQIRAGNGSGNGALPSRRRLARSGSRSGIGTTHLSSRRRLARGGSRSGIGTTHMSSAASHGVEAEVELEPHICPLDVASHPGSRSGTGTTHDLSSHCRSCSPFPIDHRNGVGVVGARRLLPCVPCAPPSGGSEWKWSRDWNYPAFAWCISPPTSAALEACTARAGGLPHDAVPFFDNDARVPGLEMRR